MSKGKRATRVVPLFSPLVRVAETGEILGHLIDISRTGLRIKSGMAPPQVKDLSISIWASSAATEPVLTVTATLMWSQELPTKGGFHSGLLAENMPHDCVKRIEAMFWDLGWPEAG